MRDVTDVPPERLRKVISAAALGNFVEWFDFAVYGFLATTIANLFFPGTDPSLSLLKTFGVFAVAFAMRPLGASSSGSWATRPDGGRSSRSPSCSWHRRRR